MAKATFIADGITAHGRSKVRSRTQHTHPRDKARSAGANFSTASLTRLFLSPFRARQRPGGAPSAPHWDKSAPLASKAPPGGSGRALDHSFGQGKRGGGVLQQPLSVAKRARQGSSNPGARRQRGARSTALTDRRSAPERAKQWRARGTMERASRRRRRAASGDRPPSSLFLSRPPRPSRKKHTRKLTLLPFPLSPQTYTTTNQHDQTKPKPKQKQKQTYKRRGLYNIKKKN
jgi:hypothetical protein